MKNVILDCGDECSFKLADGKEIRNLNELGESFESMDDDSFKQHVNGEKNDFSEWVSSAIKDEKLSEDLTQAKDRNRAQIMVLKRQLELIKEIA